MKIFLTGATGFIGSHVARLLVGEGHEVYALLREGSNPWRIADIAARLHPVRGDMASLETWGADLHRIRPDMCLHLAWYAEPGKYLDSMENLGFLTASLRLASSVAAVGCRRFVGVGTCFEYDTNLGYLAESSPTRPQSLYAACKLASSLVLERLSSAGSMEVAWARLFYLYGPFEDPRRLVPSLLCPLLRGQEAKVTKGEQVRDFLHVEDVAAALWAVAQSSLTGAVNIGSGTPVTVREVASKAGALSGRPELISLGALPYSPADPMFVCADNRRLRKHTSWIPRYDLEQGLHHTMAWWRKHLDIRP